MRTKSGAAVAGACLALACAFPGTLGAIQTDTRGAHAVPAPGKVAIDGKLDDWDLSGRFLQCYDVETLRDVYSGDVAFMYDADSLYVSIHWKDSSPMGNCHNPRYQADKGWAGDSVQLRIKTDRICHVTAWYYAAGDEPAIQIEYGKNLNEPFGGGSKVLLKTAGHVLSDGAEMAFAKDADGKGYVQEIKIPWALLADQWRPKAGEAFRCGVELLWGEADWPVHRYADNLDESANDREFFFTAHRAWGAVKIEPKGNLKLPEPLWMKQIAGEETVGPELIAYKLPRDARVTIAIDDKDGRRVRNLIAALPRKAGRHTERWDGLDDNGVPVPPGEYRWKGLYHDGIHVNWEMSFATPGHPPWDTSDGRGAFYGDHSAPQGAAAAGDYVSLACPIGEAGKHLIGLSLDGQRLWGLAQRSGLNSNYRIALATDGQTLWVSSDGNEAVYRVDVATGKYSPWKAAAKDESGKEYQVLDLKVTDYQHPKDRRGDGAPINLTCIAQRGGVLAVCLALENTIKLLDAESGATRSSISVERPAAAAFASDGGLFVLSCGSVVKVGADGKAARFSADQWPTAFGLAVGPDGAVYVSVREPDHNVKVLGTDGRVAREIGKRGGRPSAGPFDDRAMRNPGQLALDSKGRLWVPEETCNPKRTSVWNAADGALVKDFVGTTSYAGAGAFNPADPSMAFSDNTGYALDLKAGTSRPVYSFGKSGSPDDLFFPSFDSHVRVLTLGGATYLFATYAGDAGNEVRAIVQKDGRWRSVAQVGVVCDRTRKMEGDNEKYRHSVFEGHDREAYAWADANGDGCVQSGEVHFWAPTVDGAPVDVLWYYWGVLPDNRGLLTYRYAPHGHDGKGGGILRYAISGFNACGAPIYAIDKPAVQKIELAGGEGMVAGGLDGNVYFNTSPLTGVDKDGKVLFTYPSRHVSVHGSHTAGAAKPGYLIGPSSILGVADAGGEAGEVFDLNGNLGENYLFTSDGLWIQSLFKDCRGGFEVLGRAVRGTSMDAATAGGESFGGYFCKAADGQTRLVIGGTDARMLTVDGLESIRRLSGAFTYTPAAFEEAEKAVKARVAQTAKKRACVVEKAAPPPALDGKGAGFANLFDEEKPVAAEIKESWQRFLRVGLSYDGENLYAAWRVYAQSGAIRNAGQDYRTLFKTGDCVDLMLGPQKSEKGEGNLRLLISALGGKPVAVLYRKVVPGTPEKERVPFSSPWRTILFDRVTREDAVRVTVNPAPGGYLVEAAVPWKMLGVEPKPGLKLRGDFGVLSADAGGTVTVSRRYWSNGGTGLVNDVPGEADLAPEAWGDWVLQ